MARAKKTTNLLVDIVGVTVFAVGAGATAGATGFMVAKMLNRIFGNG
jgi:hypothetical protein